MRALYANIRDRLARVAIVQVSDFKAGTMAASQRVVIGDGDIPLRRICHALAGAGYTGWYDIELLGAAIEARGLRVGRTAGARALPGAVDVNPASIRVPAGTLGLRCLVWGRDGDPTALLVARPREVGPALRRFLDGLP